MMKCFPLNKWIDVFRGKVIAAAGAATVAGSRMLPIPLPSFLR